MKKKSSRFLSLLVGVAMVLTMLPAMSVTASAAATSEIALPTSAGSTLTNGNIYRVNGNTTISAGSAGNALLVQGGATVVIYIPTGYTLTLNGGSGYGTVPGGAGIYLPQNATLVLTGGGRLVATGGSSGYSYSGSGAGSGYTTGMWTNGQAYTGSGGNGGNGAGGAGAGIGGSGGYGGAGGYGGSSYGYYSVNYYSDGYGNNGNGGNSGGIGNSMGTLYVLGTVSVTATGGGAAGGAGGGSGGSYSNKRFFDGDWYYHNASGGGGGGGGGYTVSASAIGGGSGGAGGGGGGGSGSRYSSRNTWWAHSGYGGGGGSGGSSGSAATQESGCPTKGGYGGGGGSRGNSGNKGTLYKSDGATIDGRNADGVQNTHGAVSHTITFDTQGGATTEPLTRTVSYGDYMPNVTVVPTKAQHSFMGYYTAVNGGGTRYIDHRGVGLRTFEGMGDVTLYAYWVQDQFNVTLDKQTGTGGTDSFITTGNDGALPQITPPTKEYALFKGYHDQAAGGGTKYYDSVGTPVNGKKITANSVLYAFWEQTQFRLTFGRQGGTGGTDYIYTNKVPTATAPAITPPTKQGAAFLGYYTQSTGGKQIYDRTGAPVGGTIFTEDTMLYAQWNEATYAINYVLNGGTATSAPTSREYSKPTTIPAATRTGYAFLGWQVDNIAEVRHRDLKIPAFATAYAKDITLTAIWAKGADTAVQVGGNVALAPGNEATLKKDLENSFDTVVTEANNNKGVTGSDLANDNQIKLVLSVNNSTAENDKTMIDDIAQGAALSYYDISAVKEVTTAGANTTQTPLLEIPEPIAVKIPLIGDLANKASYRVYRVHEGKTELLSTDPTCKEYYSTEDGNIVICTHKFSTYGVIGAESQIGTMPGEPFERGGENMDVQGRVLDGKTNLVYKVDIAWGPMAFEYSLDKEWDPVTHAYTEGALNAWRPISFDGVNNRIRSINHSNGAVKINLAVTKNDLKGVDMSLHMFNEVTSALAPNFILPPAPIGSLDKDLEPAVAYLFLSGPPERAWIDANKAKFAKVGVITVTVEPNAL